MLDRAGRDSNPGAAGEHLTPYVCCCYNGGRYIGVRTKAANMPTDDHDHFGRFEEPSLLVLISLSNGPKHGYAIQSDVRSFAGVNLGAGTLYAVLPRLERMGLIEALPTEDRRRPYRIK